MLPLDGVARRRPRPRSPRRRRRRRRPGRARARGAAAGLPLADGDWPENRPVLGRDGQYQLPLHVTPDRPAPPPAPAAPAAPIPAAAGEVDRGCRWTRFGGIRRCGPGSTRCRWTG